MSGDLRTGYSHDFGISGRIRGTALFPRIKTTAHVSAQSLLYCSEFQLLPADAALHQEFAVACGSSDEAGTPPPLDRVDQWTVPRDDGAIARQEATWLDQSGHLLTRRLQVEDTLFLYEPSNVGIHLAPRRQEIGLITP